MTPAIHVCDLVMEYHSRRGHVRATIVQREHADRRVHQQYIEVAAAHATHRPCRQVRRGKDRLEGGA